MVHFTRCTGSHCAYHIHMWWKAGLFALFFCHDVMMSVHHVTTEGPNSQAITCQASREGLRGGVGPVYLYKKKKKKWQWGGTFQPSAFCVVNWSFQTNKQKETHWIFDSGGLWHSRDPYRRQKINMCIYTNHNSFHRSAKTTGWTLIQLFNYAANSVNAASVCIIHMMSGGLNLEVFLWGVPMACSCLSHSR